MLVQPPFSGWLDHHFKIQPFIGESPFLDEFVNYDYLVRLNPIKSQLLLVKFPWNHNFSPEAPNAAISDRYDDEPKALASGLDMATIH